MEASNRNFRYILRPILLHSIAKADNGAKKLPLGIIWCVILDTLCIYNKQNVTNYIGTKNTHNKYSCYGWQHQLWQLSFAVLVPGSLVALAAPEDDDDDRGTWSASASLTTAPHEDSRETENEREEWRKQVKQSKLREQNR